MVTIEDELSAFLAQDNRPEGKPKLDGTPRTLKAEDPALKQRNSQIILDFYGFGSPFWPSMEELNVNYRVGSRERVRQILQYNLHNVVEKGTFSSALSTAMWLETREIWTETEFFDFLRLHGLTERGHQAPRLLEYLGVLGLAQNYKTYLPNLDQATRGQYPLYSERLIVSDTLIERLQQALHAAEGLPGQAGLVELSFVVGEIPDVDLDALKIVLLVDQNVWTHQRGEEFWFTFDQFENVLVNFCERTFAVTDVCPVDKLADMLGRALKRRSPKYRYPDAEILMAWIETSSNFSVADGLARFNREPMPLTPIESDIVSVARGRGPMTADVLTSELEARGHTRNYIHISLFMSPILWVDESLGRTHYRYVLASDLQGTASVTPVSRYVRFKERLDAIEETDRDVATTGRREQSILAEWVFGDDDHADCAICQRRFAVGSLVVAHKKKRSVCTREERLDPHIVFPLCVFGCDYLYENGFVTVRDGVIVEGRSTSGETERGEISRWIGRTLPDRWLDGPESYFDNVGEGDLATEAA